MLRNPVKSGNCFCHATSRTSSLGHGCRRIGLIPKMPSCERAPSGHFGLIPAWLVACMKNLKKTSTHILTVLTNKCYSATRTKEEEQKGTPKVPVLPNPGSLKPTSETTSRVLIRLRKQSIDYFRDSYK